MKGVGFLGLLGIAFIVLKLCKVIDWSWWWITCPIWGPIAVLGLIVGYSFLHVALFSTEKQKEQMKQIADEQKRNAGKSKWQIRMEQMQQAQKRKQA